MDETHARAFTAKVSQDLKGADRVLAILKFLAFRNGGASVKEVSEAFGAPASTVHRDLNTLCRSGFVQAAGNGIYEVSSYFFQTASFTFQSDPISKLVQPVLDEVVNVMQEASHFAVRQRDSAVYRAKATPLAQIVKLNSSVGGTNPLYSTAVGKVILGMHAQSKDELISIVGRGPFQPKTEKTLRTPDELWSQVKEAKELGFAVDNEENEEGIFCVAVPARLSYLPGLEDGAISVSGLAFRTPPNFVELATFSLRSALERLTPRHLQL